MATGMNPTNPPDYRSVIPPVVSPMQSAPTGMNRAASVAGGAATGAGLGTAIFPGIGTAVGAGVGALASIFGAKSQSHAATNAATLQANAANQAATLQAKSAADQLAYTQSKDAQDRAEAHAAELANYNMEVARQNRVSSLGGYLGLPARDVPAPPSYLTGGSASTGGAPSSTGSGANYQPLMDALNKGQSPQDVINTFNQSQGLKTGGSYAWRSIPGAPGGGVVEIPGGSYLAPGSDGKWGWSAGDSGGSAAAASPAPSPSAGATSLYSYLRQTPTPTTPNLSAPSLYSTYFGAR